MLKKVGKTTRPFRYDLNQIPYSGSNKYIQGSRYERQSAWRTTERGLWHCTGGSDQDHLQKKEMQKGKMVVWGGLRNIAEKRREAKGKGEKERYIHLNAEFQRISKRDKKAFLSNHCKEIEENNRMEKTRDLVKQIRDTKGTFHAKMNTIKDRNGRDLREAKDIKKRWQEYTEEPYKKDLHDSDDHDDHSPRARHPGMWSQGFLSLPKASWVLGSITTNKASGGDGISVDLF